MLTLKITPFVLILPITLLFSCAELSPAAISSATPAFFIFASSATPADYQPSFADAADAIASFRFSLQFCRCFDAAATDTPRAAFVAAAAMLMMARGTRSERHFAACLIADVAIFRWLLPFRHFRRHIFDFAIRHSHAGMPDTPLMIIFRLRWPFSPLLPPPLLMPLMLRHFYFSRC